ncbi:hypothetical protein NZK35_17800 [Stieleria sp. ICT_E10.1]|uniref:hypothetical protein n=1 Tax=Stieleria sedimenti TaxID=2976331 RepID=UPI0021804FA2|nr:hypothetical protein [Stieleria sedimenti]MCS7468510.1 hypothetical protein [Stieleria sedimenti]
MAGPQRCHEVTSVNCDEEFDDFSLEATIVTDPKVYKRFGYKRAIRTYCPGLQDKVAPLRDAHAGSW